VSRQRGSPSGAYVDQPEDLFERVYATWTFYRFRATHDDWKSNSRCLVCEQNEAEGVAVADAARPADNRVALPTGEPTRGRIAVLAADKVEDVEFFYPYYRFTEAGYDVDVITPAGGELTGYRGRALTRNLGHGLCGLGQGS
jgi:hypothetical protein